MEANECNETDLYKEVSGKIESTHCEKPAEGKCTYKNDYECRIVHSGCLDVVTLGLGGNKTHCIEKFVECLTKVGCEKTPLCQQAKEILANPEKYAENLKVAEKPSIEEEQAKEELEAEKNGVRPGSEPDVELKEEEPKKKEL